MGIVLLSWSPLLVVPHLDISCRGVWCRDGKSRICTGGRHCCLVGGLFWLKSTSASGNVLGGGSGRSFESALARCRSGFLLPGCAGDQTLLQAAGLRWEPWSSSSSSPPVAERHCSCVCFHGKIGSLWSFSICSSGRAGLSRFVCCKGLGFSVTAAAGRLLSKAGRDVLGWLLLPGRGSTVPMGLQ